jgi:enoyl-CoA hydratase/carnithine racemase
MAEPTLVSLERRPDGVAVVRLDNPKVNALSPEVLARLADVAGELAADPPGAVVVTGGERIFAAGADISRFGSPEETRSYGGVFRRALDAVAAIPRVTIAAVAGYALGGGCELAMACDLRLASEKAVFGQPEILLGIIPGAGGTQRLPRLVGTSRAKELILSGRQVPAEEALRIGLADRVVGHESLHDEAVAWAATFARGPLAVQALAKHAIDAGLDLSLAAGLDLELEDFVAAFRTEDSTIGIKSFLAEGPGKATFTGR